MRSAEATWEAPCRQAGPSSTWEQVVAQEGFYATWCSVTDVRDPGVFREPQNTLPMQCSHPQRVARPPHRYRELPRLQAALLLW